MYFDTQEKAELKNLVNAAQINYLLGVKTTQTERHILRLRIIFIIMCLLIALALFTQYTWLILLIVAGSIGSVFISDHYCKERICEGTSKEFGEWWQEIEDIDTGKEDRELFCELMEAIESGKKFQILNLLEEALLSPVLSKTGFIRNFKL